MVNEKIINDTVKRMLTSNIDEETIVSTLKDIGIEEAKAKEIIANITSGSTPAPQTASAQANPTQTIPPVVDDTNTKIQSMQNELATQGEQTELHETTTHTLLNEHANKLDEMNKKVGDLHKVVASPANLDASLKVKLTELEEKTADISAQTKALMEVMKKILETNREILTKMK